MPEPDYRYEFPADDFAAISACNREHGFVVIRDLIDQPLVDALCDDVRRLLDVGSLGAGPAAALSVNFIERSPAMVKMLEHEPYMRYIRALAGTDDLVVHRSAAIVRTPGHGSIDWHTDYPLEPALPQNANNVLNQIAWADRCQGGWFYLTGCNPTNGGLTVIEGSHTADWVPPPGFALTPSRQFLTRAGEERPYSGMDVPGMVALDVRGTDAILFAPRTYHSTFPHAGSQARLSAGVGLRPRSITVDAPWSLPESARRLKESLPPHLRRYFDGYTGIVPDWKPEPLMVG